MAIAIREQGSRSKLIEHLKTLRETGPDGKESKDQTQMKTAVELVTKEIEALPKEFNSALIIVECQNSGAHRTITSQVIGQKQLI